MKSEDVRRILYTPPRGIGDLMFSLPLLHSIRRAYPNAQIYVPIPRDKQDVMDLVGFLNRTNRYLPKPSQDPLAHDRWQASIRGDTIEKYRLEKAIFEKYLSGEGFDLAIIPKDFKIDGIDCDNQVCESDLKMAGISRKSHMVDRFLDFADYLGIPRVMDFGLSVDVDRNASLSSGWELKSDKPYVVFNLGASVGKKVWNERGYIDTAGWCLDNGLNVILVGDKSSFDMASNIQAQRARALNTVLREGYAFDLKNFARLASKSAAVISPDTGVLHIADAIGAKVIGLYGPTSPEKYAPYNNQDNIVSRFDTDQNVQNIPSRDVIEKLKEVVR